MNKELIEFLGLTDEEVVTIHEDINTAKSYNYESMLLNVKVFSIGVLAEERQPLGKIEQRKQLH